MLFGGIELSLIQLEPSEVDQHSGRISAAREGALEEGALIFPIKGSDPGPRTKKEEPNSQNRSEDSVGNRKSRNRQARGEKEKRGRQIDPVLGDGRIQRKNAANWEIGDGCQDKAARDRRGLFLAAHQPINGSDDE